jgi:WD40 repeat protein
MTAVFISHSSAEGDRREASLFRDALLGAGYESVYLDLTGLPAMRDWEVQLHRQLAVADVIVFLYSTASATSPWCHREIGIARFRHRPVLVVPTERLDPFAGLGTLQQLPFTADREQRHMGALAELARSGYGPETSYSWDVDASPYPGLAPFEADRAAVFFGREQDVRDLESYLNPDRDGGAVVLVAGASGTGKSSLIRAGLLPRLRRRPEWVVLDVLEPGDDMGAQLERVLGSQPAGSVRTSHSGTPAPALMLVVDQAERLLVGHSPSSPHIPALEDLATALTSRRRLHVVLVTKTVDPRLTAAIADFLVAKHLVVGLSRTQLAQVVSKPAARAGMTIDPALVSRLVEATPSGEALPLLALTLAEMWNRRAAPELLTLDDYERVGGVTRIINDVTQSVLRTLPLVPQDEVVATMLAFVSVDQTGQEISVSRPLESFTATGRRIVEAFADRRLVTIKDANGETGTGTAALTHDALMSSWESLAAEIEREREQLLLENDVRREALRGERDWTLLTGPRLDAALRRFQDGRLDEPIARYLTACRQARDDAVAAEVHATRLAIQRRRWTMLAGVGVAVALVALAAVMLLQRQNTRIAALEQAARAISHANTRRDVALQEALGAIERSANPATYAALLQVLTDQPGARRYVTAPGSHVYDVAWTRGAGLLIGSDADLERVDEQTGARTRVAPGGSGQGSAIAASQDGSVSAALNAQRLLLITKDGARLVPDERALLPMVAMSADGSRIAVADLSPAVRVLDGHGRPITSWATRTVPADIAMTADGRTLAVVDGTDRLTLFDTQSRAQTVLESQLVQLARVAISPDGGTVVVMSSDGQVERVSLARRVLSELPKPEAQSSAVAFLNDGTLAIGHEDGTISLVDPVTGNRLATFGSHRSSVVAIAGTASRLASVDASGEVVVWDGLDAIPLVGTLIGQGFGLADVGDDGRVVAINETGRAGTEWPAAGNPRTLGPLDGVPTALAAGTAKQLAVGNDDGSVVILDPDLAPGPAFKVSSDRINALDWVGDRLAAGTTNGEIVLLRGEQIEARVRVANEDRAVTVLRALPNGDLAWGTGDGVVGTWSANTHVVRVLGADPSHLPVTALGYGDSGRTLYSGGDDRKARIWPLEGSGPVRPATATSHDDAIIGLAPLTGAGQSWLATASQDRTIRLWDLQADSSVGPPVTAPGGARFIWGGGGPGGNFVTLDTLDRVIAWKLAPSGLINTACSALLLEGLGNAKPAGCVGG